MFEILNLQKQVTLAFLVLKDMQTPYSYIAANENNHTWLIGV